MAQILLGAHGVLLEPDIIEDKGIPGNREAFLSMGSNIARSLVWAVLRLTGDTHILPNVAHSLQFVQLELEWLIRELGRNTDAKTVLLQLLLGSP